MTGRMCAVETCNAESRGSSLWCNRHRQRVRKHGDPAHERWPATLARIMRRITFGDCWEWSGSVIKSTGYGQVWADGTNHLAHRVVYELLIGPIPEGLQLDHLCRNRRCVNPEHLEPVTGKENIRRGHAARKAAAS